MLRMLFSLCLGLALVLTPTYAQTPRAVGTTDRHDPFVTHAESRYLKYLESVSRGDVIAYKAVLTRKANEAVLEQLKKIGKSESDFGAMLKRSADRQTDLSQFTFVRCDTKARAARLFYQREGVGPSGPTLEFAVFMIHWEDGAWRIGQIGHSSGKPTRASGEKRTGDELLGDPHFALE